MSSSYRVAVAQTLARLGDLEHNIALVDALARDAARQGARLLVLPECMNSGYLFDSAEHARQLAETVDGRYVQALGRMCRDYGLHIASGMTEYDADRDRIFNSGVLLDSRGHLLLHYHKQFLATHDQNWFAFGERGCPVVDTELGRLGLLICFDGRIPEIARCLAVQGVDVVLDMANFFAMDQADLWGPARALENGFWLVAATKSGQERSIYYPGGSMIVAPDGQVHARIEEGRHGVAVCDIDPQRAADKRWLNGNDRMADRRPELYETLSTPYSETQAAARARTPLVPSESAVKLAAVQMHCDTQTSADAVLAQLSHAAKLGANVLTLPEHAFVADWLPDAASARQAAATADTLMQGVADISRRYGCVIAAPHIRSHGGALQICTTVFGPDGAPLGHYAKTHLEAEERDWAQPGDSLPVFDTPFGRIGVMLGADGLYPEVSRVLCLQGADILLWPTRLREALHRKLLLVPRAADNRAAVVVANRTDCPEPGGSLVIPPAGFAHWDIDRCAAPERGQGKVMPAFIDLGACRQKQMIPKVDMLANRLVATYEPLLQEVA